MTGNGDGRQCAPMFAVCVTALVLAACGSGAASGGGTESAGAGGTATTAGAPATTAAQCPSPAKAVEFSQPSPWRTIGRTGPEGQYRDKDVSESTLTITNPNPIAVRAKAIVLLSDPTMASSNFPRRDLVEYGVPSKQGLRNDGGLDYSVGVPTEVPAGGSVQVAARRLTTPPPTVKAFYGFAAVVAQPAVSDRCEIPVAGADPIKLLGLIQGSQTKGCTDPAAGC